MFCFLLELNVPVLFFSPQSFQISLCVFFNLPIQVKAGFGVNLIGVAVVMLAITTWGVPLFNLTEFPAWAVARNVTGGL